MFPRKAVLAAAGILLLLAAASILVDALDPNPEKPLPRPLFRDVEWGKVSYSESSGLLELEGVSKIGKINSVTIMRTHRYSKDGRPKDTGEFVNLVVMPIRSALSEGFILPPVYTNSTPNPPYRPPIKWETNDNGSFLISANFSGIIVPAEDYILTEGYRVYFGYYAQIAPIAGHSSNNYLFGWY